MQNMKRVTILSIVVLLMFSNADAQGILNKIKSKAKQRADKKVDNEIDKKLDEAEGKGKKNKDKKEETGGNAVVSTVEAPAQPSVKSFSKFDFIPGDSILYYENFEGEQLAELPVNWNTSGTGEVVTLEKYSGNWLRLHKRIAYLADNTKVFGENYTMEFDMILQLKNNGWMYPEIRFGLFSTMDEPTTDNSFLKEEGWIKNAAIVAKIIPGEFKTTKIMLNSYKEKRAYFKGDPKSHEVLEKKYGTPVHVSIQVQKERFRMWIVEE
jgi:OmpA-OmpF porin, OOP family